MATLSSSLPSDARERLARTLPQELANDAVLVDYLHAVVLSLAASPLPATHVARVLKTVLLSAGLEEAGGSWNAFWSEVWSETADEEAALNGANSTRPLLAGRLPSDADAALLGNSTVVPFERPVQLDHDEGIAAVVSGSSVQSGDVQSTASHGLCNEVLELLEGRAAEGKDAVSLDWLANRRSLVSQVNAMALAKAEARLRQKAEKRERKEAGHYRAGQFGPSGQVARTAAEREAERQARVDAILSEGNGSEDTDSGPLRSIHLERFDISLPKRILTDASCTLVYGRRYGLIGRNGVGKSTFLRHIVGRHISGIPVHLRILHVEQEMTGDDRTALESVLAADTRRVLLLEEQERLSAAIEAGDEADATQRRLEATHRRLTDLDTDRAIPRAASILAGLGFDAGAQARATRTFSGGWRMRLALAQALFAEPDLLLLDEPTNMLDFPAVVWLQEHLQAWRGTVLVVSHDRLFLDSVATDILHLHSEQLAAYRGNYTQFQQTRAERLTNQQREYDAQLAYRQHLQAFVDRWRYNANRAPQAQSRLKILEKLPELRPVVIDAPVIFRFPRVEQLPSGALAQLDNVAFRYPGAERSVLEAVNFGLAADARVAIVGPNGAGKTTLLKLLTGALEPTSGLATLNGRLRVGYFSQHHVDALSSSGAANPDTATPVAWMAARFPGKPDEEHRRLLGAFGISGPLALQPISTLSGGQKSRLVFAALASASPHLLILDEPTNHLDMDSIDALIDALRVYNGAVIAVSHDKRFVDELSREIWICADRSVRRFEGTIHDYAASLMHK